MKFDIYCDSPNLTAQIVTSDSYAYYVWNGGFGAGLRCEAVAIDEAAGYPNQCRVFRDGSPISVSGTGAPTGTFTPAVTTLYMLNNLNNNRPIDGSVFAVAAFPSKLVDAELAEITGNPRAFFFPHRPSRKVIFPGPNIVRGYSR